MYFANWENWSFNRSTTFSVSKTCFLFSLKSTPLFFETINFWISRHIFSNIPSLKSSFQSPTYLFPDTVKTACLSPFFLAPFSTCTEFGISRRLSLANGIFLRNQSEQNRYCIFITTSQSIIFNQPIEHSQFDVVHNLNLSRGWQVPPTGDSCSFEPRLLFYRHAIYCRVAEKFGKSILVGSEIETKLGDERSNFMYDVLHTKHVLDVLHFLIYATLVERGQKLLKF